MPTLSQFMLGKIWSKRDNIWESKIRRDQRERALQVPGFRSKTRTGSWPPSHFDSTAYRFSSMQNVGLSSSSGTPRPASVFLPPIARQATPNSRSEDEISEASTSMNSGSDSESVSDETGSSEMTTEWPGPQQVAPKDRNSSAKEEVRIKLNELTQNRRKSSSSRHQLDENQVIEDSLQQLRSLTLPPIRGKKSQHRVSRGYTYEGIKIHKSGKNVPVQKFSERPSEHPNTVCFHYSGTWLTHARVWELVRGRIGLIRGARIIGIQFVPRNVILGTSDVENRWVIKVDCREAMTDLVRLGLVVNGQQIGVRIYDNVLKEDYNKYLKYNRIKASRASAT